MHNDKTRYWQDIQLGETFTTDAITINTQDILEFAADFDPQPYHLDSAVAQNSIFGGLCASGWHVCAIMMRLLTDTFIADHIDLLGSSGVSSLRWYKPVFADDTLSSVITVKQCSPPDNNPKFGQIDCAVEVSNQHGDAVIALTTALLIGCGKQGEQDNG